MFKKIYIIASALFGVAFALPASAQVIANQPPIRDERFQGSFVSQSEADPIHIGAGEKKTIVVKMKNTGKAPWDAGGKNFVSIYTVDPNYHPSLFAGPEWRTKDSPAKLMKSVKPGEMGEFSITLSAPGNTGEYVEKFYGAAENKTWIRGTGFYFKIVVDEKKEVGNVKPSLEQGSNTPLERGVGQMGEQNPPSLCLACGGRGVEGGVPVINGEQPVAVSYVVNYSRPLIPEPTIRVGLFKSPDPVTFQSEFQYVVNAENDFLGVLNPGEIATLRYEQGRYHITSPGLTTSSEKFLRLVPFDPTNYFTLPHYTRSLSGRKANFNAYRGTLEYHFSLKSNQPYLINELPLDEYTAGVAETGNDSPIEYIKALMVAVRSYGYTHRGSDLFDVFPTTNDQLYLGYNFETSAPRIAQAVKDTYGEMVTYQGAPVNTPYFSRSNGMTKSAKAVWGQDRAWLQPVEAIYDKGKSMYGHGVGMSNTDAGQRAQRDGWKYVQILKHYYTGTEVEKVY